MCSPPPSSPIPNTALHINLVMLLVLGLEEGMVEYATMCVKSWVILITNVHIKTSLFNLSNQNMFKNNSVAIKWIRQDKCMMDGISFFIPYEGIWWNQLTSDVGFQLSVLIFFSSSNYLSAFDIFFPKHFCCSYMLLIVDVGTII